MALRSRGVILLYHRIASPPADPLLLCVSPGHFEQHLEVLRRAYTPLGLEEFEAARAAGRVPDRAVAITFDDGYADNWRTAAPLLACRGLRATVFAAGACLEGEPFFYDDLERILIEAPRLPRKLRLVVDGRTHEWDLGSWSRRPKSPGQDYWSWNLDQSADPTPRHRCYRELFNILRGATAGARRRTLAALRKAAGIGSAPARLWMTRAEMRAAVKDGTLAFGAHTRGHPALNRLSPVDQREEIFAGKRMLEAAVGRPVRAFAYPYGSPWDVTVDTVRLVREAGFALACANTPGPVDAESDPFWLPRCLVRDWDGEEFAERMREFFRPRAEIPPQG
jgi:peptidoglycan/xylan/chitin deacetylase (PgdA/CDA1 family)